MTEPSADELNHLQALAYEELMKKNYRKSRELFEELYQHASVEASLYLGYIYARPGTLEYSTEKALGYLRYSAESGNVDAMSHLGDLLDDIGKRREAIRWWLQGSNKGNGDCSHNASWALRQQGEVDEADKILKIAVSQGFPPSIQIAAIQKIKGRKGAAQIGPGLLMLLKNAPAMMRYIKSVWPEIYVKRLNDSSQRRHPLK